MSEEEKDKMKEMFKLSEKAGGENEAEVKLVLNRLQKSSVSYSNHKRFVDEWTTVRRIIRAQIENELSRYSEERTQYLELRDSDRVKRAIQDERLVPRDLWQGTLKLQYHARQIVGWLLYEANLSRVMVEKLTGAVGEVRALDIERETLKRVDENVKGTAKMFQDIMQTRFESMDEKFLQALANMQEQEHLHKRDIVNTMGRILDDLQNNNKQLVGVILNSGLLSKPSRAAVHDTEDNVRQTIRDAELELEKSAVKPVPLVEPEPLLEPDDGLGGFDEDEPIPPEPPVENDGDDDLPLFDDEPKPKKKKKKETQGDDEKEEKTDGDFDEEMEEDL